MTVIEDAHRALEKFFGYSGFRNKQLEVIDAVLNRRDVLCVMATGSGKSLCYQVTLIFARAFTFTFVLKPSER